MLAHGFKLVAGYHRKRSSVDINACTGLISSLQDCDCRHRNGAWFTKFDTCLEYGPNACGHGAECAVFRSNGAFHCKCSVGFVHNGINHCIDVDECATQQHDCDTVSTTCVNTVGSFTCTCKTGFHRVSDTPKSCQDLDECEYARVFNRGPCVGMSFCINTIGGYYCECGPGFKTINTGNSVSTCIDINECHIPITGADLSTTTPNMLVDLDQSSFAVDGFENMVMKTAQETNPRVRIDMLTHRPILTVRIRGNYCNP